MPLTIFNISKVDHLYIGKDMVVAFADTLEIASKDKRTPGKTKKLGAPEAQNIA